MRRRRATSYQATCQNDQNLIHVTGRAVAGDPLPEPRPDRHGIPEEELGECVRCNLQIEGSGVKPEDVILDAGRGYENPKDPTARPGGDLPAAECYTDANEESPCWAKHVVLRTDRSDGFVGRNFLMRGAREHGFYTEETDGVLLDRVKFFWNADYGHLSFTTDHNVVQNCDGFGSGDAVVYPGAAPQTGEFRDESFYPEQRYNTTIRRCDLHGSAMGYSGSMGNAIAGDAQPLLRQRERAHNGHAVGGRTSRLPRGRDEDRPQLVLREQPRHLPGGQPVRRPRAAARRDRVLLGGQQRRQLLAQLGLRQLAPGHDACLDPRRRCGQPGGRGGLDRPSARPPPASYSTSCGNQYFGNHMGQVPPGFEPHPDLELFGNKTTLDGDRRPPPTESTSGGTRPPRAPATAGTTTRGRTARATPHSGPADRPRGDQSVPGFLPEKCATSMGSASGYSSKSPGLLVCFGLWETDNVDAPAGCDWWDTPSKPEG